MKREALISLSLTTLSLALLLPKNIEAKAPKNPPVSAGAGAADVQGDAAHMVPAQAGLMKPLDSRKIQAGQQFQAVLSEKVQLKNGPELPRGTVLIGTATAIEAQSGGSSKLILRFTEAQPKGGKAIPIKATIVGFFPGNSLEREDRDIWNPKSPGVDQVNAFYGVELQSNIVDRDSGVFVSTKKDAVKLAPGSWIALAIEALPESPEAPNGPTGAA